MKRIVFLVVIFAALVNTLATTRAWCAIPSDIAPTFITLTDSTGRTDSTCMIGSFLKLYAELVFPEGDGTPMSTTLLWEIETVPTKHNAVYFVDDGRDSCVRTVYFSDPVDTAKITVTFFHEAPHPIRKATYTVHVFNPISNITLTDDKGKTDSTCVVPNGKWKIYAKPVFVGTSVITPKLKWEVVPENASLELEEKDDFTRMLNIKGYDTADITITVYKPDGATLDSSLSATYKVYVPRPTSFSLTDDDGKSSATYVVGSEVQLHAMAGYGADIDVVPQVTWSIEDLEKVSFKDNNSGSLDRTLFVTAPGTVKITATVLRPDSTVDPDYHAVYTLYIPKPEPVSLTITDDRSKADSTCAVGTQLSLHVKPFFANGTQQGLFEGGKIPPQLVWLIDGLPEGESPILSLDGNANVLDRTLSIHAPVNAVQIVVAVRRSDGTADPVRRAVYTLHIPVPEPTDIDSLKDSGGHISSTRVVGEELVLQATLSFANQAQEDLQIFPPVVWSIKTNPTVGYTVVTFADNDSSALLRTLSIAAPVVAPADDGTVEITVSVALPDGSADPKRRAVYTLHILEPVTSVTLDVLDDVPSTWGKGDTLHFQAAYELKEVNEDIAIPIPHFAWWIEMDPPTAPPVVSFVKASSGPSCSLSVDEGYGTARVIAAVVRPDGAPHPSLRDTYIVRVSEPEPTGIKLTDLSGKLDSTCVVGNSLQLRAKPVFGKDISLNDLPSIPPVVWEVVSTSGQESSAVSFVDNSSSALDRTLFIKEPVDTVRIIVAIRSSDNQADLIRRDTYLLHVLIPEAVSIILTNSENGTSSTHVPGEQIDVRAKPVFANVAQNSLQIAPKVVWQIEDIPLEEPLVASFTVDGEEDENEENAHALDRTLFVIGYGTAHVTVSLLQPDDTPDPIRRATYIVHVPKPTSDDPTPVDPKDDPPSSLFPTVKDTEQPVVAYKDATLHLRCLAGYIVRLVTLTGQTVVAFTVPTNDYRYPLLLSPAVRILFATDGVTQRTFKLLVD
ncbi:MAG: hypothetical protein LBU03_03410 [Tannerellaceae bacterium]|nr:hypothetical protein [Tannerellaceae bacterium]